MLYVTDIHQHQLQEITLWKRVFGSDSNVSSGFLTFPVVCDLEECILRDNPIHQSPNGPQSHASTLSQNHLFGNCQDDTLFGYPHGMIPIFSQSVSEFTNQSNLLLTNVAACNAPTPVPTGLLYPIVPMSYHVTTPVSNCPATFPPEQQKHPVRPKKLAKKQLKNMSVSTQGSATTRKGDKSRFIAGPQQGKLQTQQPSDKSEQRAQEQVKLVPEDGVSTRLMKVIPVQSESVGKGGDAKLKEKGEHLVIEVSIPESQDLSAMQGQVLVSEGGKSYIVDDVKNVEMDQGLQKQKN